MPMMASDVSKEVLLERIELGALQAISPMILHDLTVQQSADFFSHNFMLSLHGYIYGKRGLTATDTVTVREPDFPRWLPKWLRRRWMREREIRLDCTPLIVFPEVPHVFPGTPRVVLFDKHVHPYASNDEEI